MKRTFKHGYMKVMFEDMDFRIIIEKHLKSSNKETGGVLCGKYSDDLREAIITNVESPTVDSVGERFSFIRGIKGLKDRFTKMWKENKYYVGEWHLHPHSSSHASEQDKRQLLENSYDVSLNCKVPIMIIVGFFNGQFSFSTYFVKDDQMIEMREC